MAATERPSSPQDKCETANSEAKTIFNILSKLKESEPTSQNKVFVTRATLHFETDDDIAILRKDPDTNQSTINKSAYLKLHRSLSPNRNSAIDVIKKKYDEVANPSSQDSETLESIKQKYSPSGYNKPQPAPKPRRSKLTRSQIILPAKREQAKTARFSLNIEKNKYKDVNSNNVQNDSSDEEFVTIITRSDSEESVLRFQKELSAFTMDKKKRANSFRKIFSVFSNKDKKKKQEDKNKTQNKENGETNTVNVQNESNTFSRQTPYRHTTGGANANKVQKGDSDKCNEEELEKDYAQMHINQFNKFKHSFENGVTRDGYTPIYKSNEANNTYMNMPNIRKYIDTSSSASTLESDRSNIYHSETPTKEGVEIRTYPSNSFRPSRISDNRRDTPPRLLETQQDVRLVNPKALIPINSERPLPNPYQNNMPRNKPLSHSTPTNQPKGDDSDVRRPYLNDTYGTVFDSLENRSRSGKANHEKPPRSPVEPSKLKLPPNREIVPLTPRVRSPIPPDNVSTEKIIATELLRPKRSPTPTKKVAKEEVPSHQRLEIDIDYPENLNYASQDSLLRDTNAKPPMQRSSNQLSRMSQASRSSSESVVLRQRISQASPLTTNAQVHMNRTPTPNNQNLSISPIRPNNNNARPSTPSGSQIPESPKTTPQKEDMRKSVEAYYWKEIKKLKDQENYELYIYQMQYNHMLPYGFAEDPVNLRRSRSMSPSANRNGRRSLSLPREPRPPTNIIPDKYYPNAIPENRAVVMQPRSVQQLQFQQQQYFQRNTPERSTIDGSPRKYDSNTNSLYRPIFKRGSLNAPTKQMTDDSLKRKVSFSGAQDQNVQSWPTKNGFTQSPPQRRIDKPQSPDDDEVFYPNNDNRYTQTNSDLPNEEMYYNTRQNIIGFNLNTEPTYVLRASQNSLYIHQRQPAENPYGQRNQRRVSNQQQEDALYGQPIDAVRRPSLTRHGSIQIQEELYGQRPGPRRFAYQNNNRVPSTPVNQEAQYLSRRPPSQQSAQPLKREIIVNDEIFGQFGGYSGQNNNIRVVQPQNLYASRQSIAEYNSRVRDLYYSRPQVSINNKVCDIYGQIHDNEPPKLQQTGVLMGQLQQSPGSPAVVRSSHTQLAGRDNFVRNSRLTASANDMYRRVQNAPQSYTNETLYGRIEQTQMLNGNGAPNRPLPPVPQRKIGVKGVARSNLVSDNESGSDASEIRKILNSNGKSKKRGIFGK